MNREGEKKTYGRKGWEEYNKEIKDRLDGEEDRRRLYIKRGRGRGKEGVYNKGYLQ